MINETYRNVSEALSQAPIKYAFVVFDNNQIIEIGNRFKRTQYLDKIGSTDPQS
jgi:hypothetical protein